MHRWSVRWTYKENCYGDGYVTESYKVTAPDSITALDITLTQFLRTLNAELDDVFENLDYSYCVL